MPGNDQYTKILLPFDDSLTDINAGGSAHTWTAHGGANDTSPPQFGPAAAGFATVATDLIDTPDSADFTLGSGDFTVDFWFNCQGGFGTNRYLAEQDSAAGTDRSFYCQVSSSNLLLSAFSTGGTGATTVTINGPATPITTQGYHHYAFVRFGNVFTTYLDGVGGTPVTNSGTVFNSASNFTIGNVAGAGVGFNGYIDEFRLSVGIARWTSNFTPPTQAYDQTGTLLWQPVYSDIVPAKQSLAVSKQQFLAASPFFVTPSFGWFNNLSDPIRLKPGLKIGDQRDFFPGLLPNPNAPPSMGYFQYFRDPVRFKVGLAAQDQPSFTSGFLPLPNTAPSFAYYQNFSNPIWLKRILADDNPYFFADDYPITTWQFMCMSVAIQTWEADASVGQTIWSKEDTPV